MGGRCGGIGGGRLATLQIANCKLGAEVDWSAGEWISALEASGVLAVTAARVCQFAKDGLLSVYRPYPPPAPCWYVYREVADLAESRVKSLESRVILPGVSIYHWGNRAVRAKLAADDVW